MDGIFGLFNTAAVHTRHRLQNCRKLISFLSVKKKKIKRNSIHFKVERIVFYLNEVNIDFEDESALAQVIPMK